MSIGVAASDMPTALGGTAKAGIVRSSGTIGCYLVLAFFTFVLTLQGTIAPFLKADLGLSYRMVGLHASAIAIGAILVGLAGDRVVRRHGRRRMLILGLLGCMAGAMLLAAAPVAAVSIAGCALIGIGGSFLPTVAFAILADLHGPQRSLAINEAAALNYALAMLAPLLTGLSLWRTLGWRAVVLIGAAMGCGRARVPRHRRSRDHRSAGGGGGGGGTAAAGVLVLLVRPDLCHRHRIFDPAVGQRISRAGHRPRQGTGGNRGGRLCARHVHRAGVGQSVGAGVRHSATSGGRPAVALVGFLVYWGVSQPAMAIAGLLLLGIGVSLLFPLTVGLALGAAGSASDAASARSTIAFGVALLTMPVLLGGLADHAGLRNAHWLIPVLILATLFAFGLGRMLERGR